MISAILEDEVKICHVVIPLKNSKGYEIREEVVSGIRACKILRGNGYFIVYGSTSDIPTGIKINVGGDRDEVLERIRSQAYFIAQNLSEQ